MDIENANKSSSYLELGKQDEDSFATKLAKTDEKVAYTDELIGQGNPDDDSLSTKPPTPDEHISSAEKFVRDASRRIGLRKGNVRLDQICQAMKEEYVIDHDQLEYIDSTQWQMMGAPVGLVATLRHQLALDQKKKEDTSNLENQGVQNQSDVSHNATAFQQSRPKPSLSDVDKEMCDAKLAIYQDTRADQNECSKKEDNHRLLIFKRMISALFKVTKPLDWGYPVLHRRFFKSAYLYTMSGSELKQTVINASELWFVALTLILGVIVALWEIFPGFEGDKRFGTLEVAYNCLAFLGASLCLFALAINAVTFVVSASVHESNFKSFYIFILNAGLPMDVAMIISFGTTMCLLLLLLHAKNSITLSENNMSHNVDFMTVSMFGVFMLFWIPTYLHINFISRLAFHCQLLKKNSRDHNTTTEKDFIFPNSFGEYELEECDSTLKNIVHKADKALDSYYQYYQNKSQDPSKRESLKKQQGTRRLLFRTAHVPVF